MPSPRLSDARQHEVHAARAHRPLLALASLTLTACAAQVPWPPDSGACIEVYKRPGRRVLPRYWIAGVPATREEVERVVYELPGIGEKARHDETVGLVGVTMFATGGVTEVAGIAATAATWRLPFVAIIGAGTVTAIAGIAVLLSRGDAFREGVVAFNEQARRRGYCLDPSHPLPRPRTEPPAPPLGPAPREVPPQDLPDLPTRGWTP